MARIALMSGSLRAESANSAVIATARHIIEGRAEGHRTSVVSPRDFPWFDEDVERTGAAEPLSAARERIATADALIISSPAYNGYPSGVLKNALDWLSRPTGGGALSGLPVAIASASPGRAGGANVQPHLRSILINCGAVVVECDEVAIGDAVRLRTAGGLIVEPGAVKTLERLTEAALAAARERAARRVCP
ncbi:NAD(P)H-dependent oxidoreductase [Streptomyces sp. Edi4]|uniref:NADPH-dependent FMN reductase n=1 Tax=Streptomyces sp. Edi4 TaxID=3162527 RepID=UPI00330633A4